jgi:hypothetical protein
MPTDSRRTLKPNHYRQQQDVQTTSLYRLLVLYVCYWVLTSVYCLWVLGFNVRLPSVGIEF